MIRPPYKLCLAVLDRFFSSFLSANSGQVSTVPKIITNAATGKEL
jgi:hypothetical protein